MTVEKLVEDAKLTAMNKAFKDYIGESSSEAKKFATEAYPILDALFSRALDEATKELMINHALFKLLKGPLKNFEDAIYQ